MTNALLSELAKAYSTATIEFPQLRAVSLAQWLIESGRATSDLATLHNNFGGLKFRPEMAPFATKVSVAASDGTDDYCKFATLEKFIAGYWAFLERAPYKGFRSHVATPEDFIRFIAPIYCPPNPNYADDVLILVPEAQGLLDKAGAPAPVPAPSPAPAPTKPAATAKLGAIVLDPGHGGTARLGGSSPNNATSISGVLEKKLALDFCNILKGELISQAAKAGETVDVFLTRTIDINVGIADRAKMAGTTNAKLFLSLHFNGFDKPAARGPETYYGAASNGNINLAADKAFAEAVHKGLLDGIRSVDPTVTDRGVKPDNESGPKRLGTLNDVSSGNTTRAKKCSAAYIEAEFITNPTVERVLISGPGAAANRQKVLASVAGAMLAHIRAMP